MNDYTGHTRNLLAHGDYITHDLASIRLSDVRGRAILDSRGNPTVTVTVTLSEGIAVSAAAPSGASTGAHEVKELRDGGDAFLGRGVAAAVDAVNGEIRAALIERSWHSIEDVDAALRELDGTGDLSRLGANAIVAVSMAVARAFAHAAGIELYAWIASHLYTHPLLPVPHFNVLNGGAHAANDLAFQEFMIAPVGAATEAEAIRIGAEVYQTLGRLVREAFPDSAGLGDEGGYAPALTDAPAALDLLVQAIRDAGYEPSRDQVAIALDPAANSFYAGGGSYSVDGRLLTGAELGDYYRELAGRYPIRSIEDGFAEDDPESWKQFAASQAGLQIVGDDLYVTDATRIARGAELHLSTAVLIKPNQIGTVSGTFSAIRAAFDAGMTVMVSHRSGETSDTFIADLAVGCGCGQIKAGAPARGERVAKYNRLTQIESEHGGLGYGLTA